MSIRRRGFRNNLFSARFYLRGVGLLRVLITGVAGFIGMHLAKRLLEKNFNVFGIDNLCNYYDVRLKEARLDQLKTYENFNFSHLDIVDRAGVDELFEKISPDYVIHLAAQAGVRFSIENPSIYAASNLLGFTNVIEAAKNFTVKHFVYASSSSVYGNNPGTAFSEDVPVDFPRSYYAATKRSNELIARAYSHQFGLSTTGLRLFTVLGPWGRPDMSLYKFVHSALHDQPITLYNAGDMLRDFTFIDDAVISIEKIMNLPPDNAGAESISEGRCFRLINVGSSNPISVLKYVNSIEGVLGKSIQRVNMSANLAEVRNTFANVAKLKSLTGYSPETDITVTIERFVNWYHRFGGSDYI